MPTYVFDHWEVVSGSLAFDSAANPSSLVMNGDYSIRAVYREETAPPIRYSLTITSTPVPITFNLTKVS